MKAGNENVAYRAESIDDYSDGLPTNGVYHNIEKIIIPNPKTYRTYLINAY